MKLKYVLFSTCLMSIFLSACTLDVARPTNVNYISQDDPTWLQHLSKIQQIKSYHNQGQLGYINNKERFSTRFDWQYQNSTNYVLALSSNISSSTLTIEMRNNILRIFDNKGNERSAEEARVLLIKMMGAELPLDKFAFWLKGQPSQNTDYKVGENHLLASFDYPINGQAWTADYLSYHSNLLPLPKDILLKTEGQTLKIRVDNWKY